MKEPAMSRPSFFRKFRLRHGVTTRSDAVILLGPTDGLPAEVVFRYVVDQPYTVHMTVYVGGAGPSEWTFDRGLLIEGVKVPTGIGLVHIWPSLQESEPRQARVAEMADHIRTTGAEDDLVVIQLGTPEAHARLATSAPRVREFVDRIQQAVAVGAESDLLNLDSALAEILSNSGQPESGPE